MSYTLRFDEMLEAARNSDMPNADIYVQAAEGAATALAQVLATHLGVKASRANLDLAILGAVFSPAYDGQAIPEELLYFDSEDEWGE
jgi:hypothetical protein